MTDPLEKDIDNQYMQRALDLAERGRFSTHPNPRVGCVLVKNGKVIGEGYHAKQSEPHAEVNAIQHAQDNGHDVAGATAYVTLEPCSHTGLTPPCARKLVACQIERVVIGVGDPNPKVSGRGVRILEEAGVQVTTGVLEAQAKAINAGFMMRMSQNRPFVRLKTASSLDGRTAMLNGDSVWITGDKARADVQMYRAQADAIITGVGTVLADNPTLNARFTPPAPYEPMTKQPLRVILDSTLRTPLDAKILQAEGNVVLMYDATRPTPSQVDALTGLYNVEAVPIECMGGVIGLDAVLAHLASRGINECHLECGHTLASAFLNAGLVDEWVHYTAPCLMGAQAMPLVGMELDKMSDVIRMGLKEVVQVGEDVRFTLKPL